MIAKHFSLCLLLILLLGGLQAQDINTITYQKDDSNFANPERGWYKLWYPNGNNVNPFIENSDLQSLKADGNGTRLVLHKIIIPNNTAIPAALLDKLQQEADRIRANGFKVIYRFTYNWNQSISQEDAPLSRILSHLDQLAPFFQTNADIIAFVEPGFVGHFGEWHHSSNNLLEGQTTTRLTDNSRQIVSKLLKVLPKDRMTGIRYPHLKWVSTEPGYPNGGLGYTQPLTSETAYDGSDASRLGYYNQRYVANPEEDMWGSYTSPSPERDYPLYMSQDTEYVPCWGEPEESDYAHSPESAQKALDEAALFHYVSLNGYRNSSPKVYQLWKNTGTFAELSRKLGYRYRLIEATAPTSVNAGQSFALTLRIANDGYARPVNPRAVALVLRGTDGALYTIPFKPEEDERLWLPGGLQQKTVVMNNVLPSDIPAGTYQVLLNLPDPYPSLAGNPDYSIRLANQNMWESSTGYNNLNITLQVKKDTNVPSSGTGLSYALYGNKTLSNSPISTGTDATINFNWQYDGKASGQPTDNFSVRWTGQVAPAYSQEYTFYTQADDGTRLWVNGKLLVDDWTNHAVCEKSGKITLEASKKYDIRLEYFENGGRAVCKLLWSSDSQNKQVIPKDRSYPSVATARLAASTKEQLEEPESAVTIYPNPTSNGKLTITGVDAIHSQVYLHSLLGQRISVSQHIMDAQHLEIALEHEASRGIYILQIHTPDGAVLQRKVVIE